MYIIVVGGVVVIDINLQYILSLTTCTYRTVARDIMRFVFGVYLTNHSREARFEGPKL